VPLAITGFRDCKVSLIRDAQPKPDDHDFVGLDLVRTEAAGQREGGIMPPGRHPIF
jgi:hypothetical protein